MAHSFFSKKMKIKFNKFDEKFFNISLYVEFA